MQKKLGTLVFLLGLALGGCGSSDQSHSSVQLQPSSGSNQAITGKVEPESLTLKEDEDHELAFVGKREADSYTITPYELQTNGDLLQSSAQVTQTGQLPFLNTPGLILEPKSKFLLAPDNTNYGAIRSYAIGPHGQMSLASKFWPVNGVITAIAANPRGRFVYLGRNETLVPLTLSLSGQLDYVPDGTALCDSPVQYIAPEAKGDFVYVAGFFRVISFSLDPTGRLVQIGSLPTQASICAMASSPKSEQLFVALQLSDRVQIQSYAIGGQGHLSLVSSTDFPESATYMTTDRRGRFLYVGGNSLGVYSIGSNGSLTAVGSYSQVLYPTADPAGDFLFGINPTLPTSIHRWTSDNQGILSSHVILPNIPEAAFIAIGKARED